MSHSRSVVDDLKDKVRPSVDIDHKLRQRRWVMGKMPDVQNLSEQFDEPDTFWECSFCCKELTTIRALTAYVDVKHQGQLLLYDCKLCKFRTGEASLLQVHEAEIHNMSSKAIKSAATTPDAGAINCLVHSQKRYQPIVGLNRPMLLGIGRGQCR